MFKVSIPEQKVKTFSNWLDVFDQFCEHVRDEEILEKYSVLLERFDESHGFNNFFNGTKFHLKDVKFILEGSKDHKTITFSIEGKDDSDIKKTFKFYVISHDDF